MSGKAAINNGKGNSGISGIPAGSRKMVQSLKEIVNCPEPEIYAMLKDCNMDPNEAVNRLLSQDPFHEVKSKREKKKETKDTTEPRSRVANNATHRAGRVGADRYGRGGSSQFSSNDPGVSHGKPAYKKENGTNASAGSSSAPSMAGTNINRRPILNSDLVAAENKLLTVGASDGVSLSSQPTAGFQSPWVGVPGQVSMADIVKMGRPHNKAMPPHHSVNHRHPAAPPLTALNHDLHLSENYSAKVSEVNAEPEVTASQLVHANDEWPSIEPSAVSMPPVLEAPSDSELCTDPSNLPLDRVNQHMQSELDDTQSTEDDHIETFNVNHVGPTSVSSRTIKEDDAVGSSMFESNLYGNMGSYQTHRHAFEHEAEDGASSVAANLQHLSLQGEDQAASSDEDNPSVIIPNHLQVHAQDCSHLSFGSFGSGIGSAFPGAFASRPLKNNLEETSEVVDASSAVHSDARNTEYYGDEHLRNAADDNLIHRAGVSPGNYDSPAGPQPEVLKEETPEAAQGNQYAFPSSASGYTFENSQQLNAAFSNPQTSSQMQNMTPFSNVMQAYTNSLPSTLLTSTVQQGREPDLPYSPFPVTQSMPTKYSNTASSISGPSISMPEALRAPSISTPQPTPQTLPGGSVATGPALQQHLAVHPYSQPTLPLGPFANMIGYPFLPQSYTYMPSAFQQTFAGNSTYHQSLAAVLPQYKNSVSVTSLPQSAAVASAYGFGSSTSVPAGGTTIGYDDGLSSQYKDGNHLISLQQNDNSAMWVHGPGSRTMSAVPASTYYSFQGQNQQPAGYRQGQQLSQQHFGALGYPNYYHSQTGISLELQQQNSREGSLGGSQGQPSKQTQQLWQNSY
ncbi:conserved hypothetical protein [Ricinus communis]|uniref:GBF-interacting protein 1 N-terminal domain-containing protein n=1 Tax=Ricinus communis TaxID=3988 RepID=B9S173_RICCO|nr:conserved hypothetical protein [Ricinus communis]|eukprot:XP_002519742.1 uncharacterized protein LOC8284020 isoform X1 [Ricinus communis]